MAYAELHTHSAYTFQEGTDLPDALVKQAIKLGLSSIAILDVDGMYSAIQTSQAAKEYSYPVVYGSEMTLGSFEVGGHTFVNGIGLPKGSQDPGIRLPVLAKSQEGYHQLCTAISKHNLTTPGRKKGEWTLTELASYFHGEWAVLTGTDRGPLLRVLREKGTEAAKDLLRELTDLFGKENVIVESNLRFDSSPILADSLADLAFEVGVPLVATGAIRCSVPGKQALADVLTASRLNKSLSEVQPHLVPYGSFLRSEKEMLKIHHRHPEAVNNAAVFAKKWTIDLSLMKPELPKIEVPTSHTDSSWLRELTERGAKERYGIRVKEPAVWEALEHELQIIDDLGFPGYFLIVKDIVDFCRKENILCQGRGSAANSVVCYALGITAVDAVEHKLMFERFLSPEREGPPDIDIDIEAARREEVIQYVYRKYGRERAAQVANTVTYRSKSSLKAAGKALGYSEELIGRWSRETSRGWRMNSENVENSVPPLVEEAAKALRDLPQHMSIHPAGIVLTKTPVSQICPVSWATKDNRSVLQWDKDDCAEAGLVKFDLLGLGMLTALRKCFTWLNQEGKYGDNGKAIGLYNIPSEDPEVYALLCAAETVGVFQVESRAQMSTLPRMKPKEFYDLVIEVALIRPGPIHGKAVNPYLRRRNEDTSRQPPHKSMEKILERTLGVPLFQEQLMQIVVEVADFSPSEADELRRAIGSKRSEARMEKIRPHLYEGMERKGIPPHVREQIFAALKGFAEFGFPESHAFSFAYLVYASAWLKVHRPEHFYAAILASQPMGFYSPASLVSDAKRHGVKVSKPSIMFSDVESSVEKVGLQSELQKDEDQEDADKLVHNHKELSVRLGLDRIKGLSKECCEKIVREREKFPFSGLADFAARTHLSLTRLEYIAQAGGFEDLGLDRRQALWEVGTLANTDEQQPFIPGTELGEETPLIPQMSNVEILQTDYLSTGISTDMHPMELVRETLAEQRILPIRSLDKVDEGMIVKIGGLITHRQRPGTSKNVTFLSLEDESGMANIICSPGLWHRYVQIAMTSTALIVTGRIEKKEGAMSILAQKLEYLQVPVKGRSRDFR